MLQIFYTTLFLFIFGLGLYIRNIDNDFFARLIVGKTYFQTASLLNWDFLSYTPTHRFIDHEWGSSLIFYFVQSNFGDKGLLIFKAIIYFATFFLLTKVIFLHNKNAKMHFLPFLFLINAIPSLLFTTIRCQGFTFFFFTLWLYTLEKVRLENNTRLLWILPATMLIWGNLHGGCAAGFGLLLLYIIGEFLNKKPIKKYIITFAICFAVLFINPYGVEYLKFLLDALTLKRELITEWQGSFSALGLKYNYRFIILLIISAILSMIYLFKFGFNYKKINKTKVLVLIVTLLMAIKSIRLQPFFVFALTAFCYNDFYKIFTKKLPQKIDNLKEIILFGLIFFFALGAIYTTKMQCNAIDYPILEVEFLKANKIKGNILCEFHDGSYVAYKLYPNNFIFMDGKYEEVYPNDLIYVLKDINLVKNGWEKHLQTYPTDIIILSKSYDIYMTLINNKDYKLVTQSPAYALFIKKELVKKNFKTPNANGKYYMDTKFDTNIDWSVK